MKTVELNLGGNVGNVVVPEGFEEIGKEINAYNQAIKSAASWAGTNDKFDKSMFEQCSKHAEIYKQNAIRMLAEKPQFREFASGVVFWFNFK